MPPETRDPWAVDQTGFEPAEPTPRGPTVQERLQQARDGGADSWDAAATPPAPAQPARQPEPEPDGRTRDQWGEIPAGFQRDPDAPVQARSDSHADDPAGTYRDELDRLRDEETGELFEAVEATEPETPAGQDEPEDVGTGQPAAQEPTAEEREALRVMLPGRRETDPAVEFIAPDQETAERLRQGLNDGMRRREYNERLAELEDRERAQDRFFDALRDRPADVLVDSVRPELRREVVERLLAAMPDSEFERIIERAAAWADDPMSRQTAATQAENRALRAATQERDRLDQEGSQNRFIRDISRTIVSVAEMVPEAQADSFIEFALFRLLRANENGREISVSNMPVLLQELGVLEMFGLTPDGVRATLAGSRPSPAQPARPAQQARPADAAEGRAERAGPEVRERIERRRAVAATAPGGAGVAAAQAERLPAGQTVSERLRELKQRMLR